MSVIAQNLKLINLRNQLLENYKTAIKAMRERLNLT